MKDLQQHLAPLGVQQMWAPRPSPELRVSPPPWLKPHRVPSQEIAVPFAVRALNWVTGSRSGPPPTDGEVLGKSLPADEPQCPIWKIVVV